MDIGSAFTFMFDDEEWVKKLAIGGGIALLASFLSSIVVGLVLFLPLGGYMLETLKNVRDERPTPLPEWSDLGNLFMQGLMVFVITLIYNIPVLLLACIFGGVIGAAGWAELDPGVLSTIYTCIGCIFVVVAILISILIPAALIRYAKYNTLSAALQIGEIISFVKNNIGSYVIVLLLAWVASLLANLGILLCFIGVFFTIFWSMLVTANLFGQLAKEAV